VAEPSLVLTLVGNPPGRDGFLTMNEILGLDLTAEAILLSACNTAGAGDKAGRGEGFAGLTRSFMYAGGRSLLVTHWEVESEAARDLIVSIFENLGGGRAGEAKNAPPPAQGGLAEALRKAKLAIMSGERELPGGQTLSLSHPFFWAPFTLVGEGR
jgi:CHAT domain-containing protein